MNNKWYIEKSCNPNECKCSNKKNTRGMENHPSSRKPEVPSAPEAFPVYSNTDVEDLAVFLASNEFEVTTKGILNKVVMVKLYRDGKDPVFARPGDTIILYAKNVVVIANTHLHNV